MDLGWSNGKRDRKYVYARSRRAAVDKLDEAKRLAAEGLPLSERNTVASFLEWWINDHVPGRVATRTLPSYRQKVVHIVRILGHVRLNRLTSTQVESAFNQLLREGHSPGGVRAIRAVFRTAMREADRKGLVARNVVAFADGPRIVKRDKDPLTIEEVRAIREQMTDDRLMPLFFVGLALGLREGEAFGVRWSDVDLDKAVLILNKQIQRVPHEGFVFDELKTKASKAPLELTSGQVAMLREHRRRLMKERLVAGSEWTELDLVFPTERGGPLDSSGVRRHFHRVCAKAGVRPRRIHDWRVTAASWLADLNVHADTAKQVLRHSQSSTTMEYYTRSSSESRRAAIQALDQLFNG
jgi:integrase